HSLLKIRERTEVGVIHVERSVLSVEQVENVGAIVLVSNDGGTQSRFGLRPQRVLVQLNQALGRMCPHQRLLNLAKYVQPHCFKLSLSLRNYCLRFADL